MRQSNIIITQMQNGYAGKIDGQLTAPELIFAFRMLEHELLTSMRRQAPTGALDLGGVPVRRADQPRGE